MFLYSIIISWIDICYGICDSDAGDMEKVLGDVCDARLLCDTQGHRDVDSLSHRVNPTEM